MTQATPTKISDRFRSLNTKMSLIMAVVLFVCMTSLMVFFLVDNLKRSVMSEQQRLASLASVYSAVLSEPVSRSDKSATRDVLRSLRDIQTLRQAAVHNAQGELLGEMGGGAVLERTVSDTVDFALFEVLHHDTVRLESDIVFGALLVGKLRLIADISWVVKQFWLHVAIALAVAAVTAAVALVLGNLLIRRASRRLTKLSSGLADIGTKETLSFKFKRESNDEVGILVDAFNDMMGRIDERDRALRSYNENLEKTVSERTHELVIARDEAESANAAKSEFLAMMSHEIRTPMNGMMVMAQMLAAAPLSPRHLRFAEVINRSGQNLLAIINDVLDISKIEAGKLVIEENRFSIDDILADLHGLFHERAREKSISISYSVDPSVPEVLIGDATRLNQVITNLVNNALKFTEKGGVTISAATKIGDKGLCLQIKVSDTGIGIAQDKLNLVFERFTQADQSITRRFGGTGLGLAISRRLVEAMDGTISVQSREGLGSTFEFEVLVGAEPQADYGSRLKGQRIKVVMADALQSKCLVASLQAYGAEIARDADDDSYSILLCDDAKFVDETSKTAFLLESSLDASDIGYKKRGRLVFPLPATRSALQQLADAVAAQDYSSFRAGNLAISRQQDFSAFRGLRALAVDDNTVNREVLVEALLSMGIEADTAVNGEEALLKAKAYRYDIIFMDCSMPVMDGYTATRILRDREKGSDQRLPIVAITALTEKGGRDDWRNAGMDAWISKPFTVPAISRHISSLVLKHSETQVDLMALSDDQRLVAQYEAMPLLDEQTVSMLTRLGMKGSVPAVRKIYDLFVAHGTDALDQLTMALHDNHNEQGVEIAHSLHSIAQSAGALRLAAIAAQIEDIMKSGAAPQPLLLTLLRDNFEQSKQQLGARFGLTVLLRSA